MIQNPRERERTEGKRNPRERERERERTEEESRWLILFIAYKNQRSAVWLPANDYDTRLILLFLTNTECGAH